MSIVRRAWHGVRLASLDAFRGITIAGMLLVNNQGDWSHVFPVLRHASWHGMSGADLVFPFFLFIMGAALPLATGPRLEDGSEKGSLLWRAIIRTLILFLLGMILNLFPRFDLGDVRIPGVLQRIALCYLCAATLYILCGRRIRPWITVALVAGYILLLKLTQPQGWSGTLDIPMDTICFRVDSVLFAGHTYRHAITPGFDPEGLVSTAGALISAMLGTHAGDWLRSGRRPEVVFKGMIFAAVILCTAGLIAHPWLPLNKNLWTPSYALLTAGAGLAVLAPLYYVMDMQARRGWALPFTAMGTNALAAYFLSSVAATTTVNLTLPFAGNPTLKAVLYERLYASWIAPEWASAFYALGYVVFWTLVMMVLYRKKVFISI